MRDKLSLLHTYSELENFYGTMPMAFAIIEVMRNDEQEPYDFKFHYANTALGILEDIPREQLIGKKFYEIFPNGDRSWLIPYHQAAYQNTSNVIHQFSPEIGKYLNITCYPFQYGFCACLLINETEFILAQKELEYYSEYDHMTKLYNRNKYLQYINKFKPDNCCSVGVIYVDINNLKKINDKMGHDYGDQLIISVARIIKLLCKDMRCFRLSGDEIVIVSISKSEAAFQSDVQSLKEALCQNNVSLASCGYAWEESPRDIKRLISLADKRMYEEKVSYYKSSDTLNLPLHIF